MSPGSAPGGDDLPEDVHPGWGPGWQPTSVSRVVGHGDRAFARARAGLLGWDVQRLAGVRVPTTTPAAGPGVRVRQTVGPGGLLVALCRVDQVVDEPRRAGFTYVALTPHPEDGEESFLVTHRDDDAVVLTITSRSRLAWLPARLVSPLARLAQRAAVSRYLRAGRDLAR